MWVGSGGILPRKVTNLVIVFVPFLFFSCSASLSLFICLSTCAHTCLSVCLSICLSVCQTQKWGPLCWEPSALTSSPFKVWSTSEYSRACFTHCQEYLSYLLCSQYIKLLIFRNLSLVFPCIYVAKTGSWVGLQNRIAHPVHCPKQLLQVPMLVACAI